jgi:O-antigen/teichoic acid export membrane protein
MSAAASEHRSALRQIGRNFTTALSSSILVGILGLLTVAANTRALPIADIGTLIVVQAYANLITALLTFTTQLPLIRMGVYAIEHGEIDRLHGLVRFALLLDMLAGVGASALALLLAVSAGAWLGLTDQVRFGLLIFAPALLFGGLSSGNGILRLVNRFDVMRTVDVGVAGVTLLGVLALWVVHAPLWQYFFVYSVAVGLLPLSRYAAARLVFRRQYPITGERKPLSVKDRRDFFAFAVQSSLASTIETFRVNADTVIASRLFSHEVVGIYGVAKQLSGVVRKFANFPSLIAYAEVGRMVARKDMAGSRALVTRVCLLVGAFGAACVIGAILLGRPALGILFGPGYVPGYVPLILLMIAATLQLVHNPISMYVQVLRGGAPVLYANGAGLLAFATVVACFVSWFGILTIAAAHSIFFLVVIAAFLLTLRRGVPPRSPMVGDAPETPELAS